MAHSSSRDPAALLRGHLTSPARSENEQYLARIGRARLTQRMAATPVNHGLAFNPALRLASGLAALALIAVAAVHFYLPVGARHAVPDQQKPQRASAETNVPPHVSAETNVPPQANAEPKSCCAAGAGLFVNRARHAVPLQVAKNNPPQALTPSAPYPLPSTLSSDPAPLRIAKVADGIRITWDGQRVSNQQYELIKTCVDLRQPGIATTLTRIRLNTSEWVDHSDFCNAGGDCTLSRAACAPGEAAQYEVSEVGHA